MAITGPRRYSPVFAPMGFGAWQAAVALLTGLIAKEAVTRSHTWSQMFCNVGIR